MGRRLSGHFGTKRTPQTEPIPGRTDMVQNPAGGYVWEADKWGRLDRFLLLGTEGGTLYASEHKLTVDNANSVIECIKEDASRVVQRIVEISDGGKAAKNDYALFALALVMTFAPKPELVWDEHGFGYVQMGGYGLKDAYWSLDRVARTGSHLLLLVSYIQDDLRGWSRGLRSAVSDWYVLRDELDLAYQLIKYQNRNGITHRDVLRLAHPEPQNDTQRELFHWVIEGKIENPEKMRPDVLRFLASANYALKGTRDHHEIISFIKGFNLPREAVPTWMLGGDRPEINKEVWEALLGDDGKRMPMTALLRNLGNLAKNGVLVPLGSMSNAVAERIANREELRKKRIHPFNVLTALMTYSAGHSFRGSGSWHPAPIIIEALEAAFHLAFENVEPAGKRVIYGVDCSGSMGVNDVLGIPTLTPARAAGAMALVSVATEVNSLTLAFDHNLYHIDITPSTSVRQAMEATRGMGGGTNAALPILGALDKGWGADAFVIITDNETWHGNEHPSQALEHYRKRTGIPAKLVVVAMTAGFSSIGDPQDPGTLSVVGMSTDTPRLITEFIRD